MSATKCHTAGAAAGTVLLEYKSTLVYINQEKAEVGVLMEVKEGTIECGALKIRVRGSDLASISPVNKYLKTSESLALSLSQTKGVQTLKEYESGEEVFTKPKFEANFGLGFEQAGREDSDTISLEEEGDLRRGPVYMASSTGEYPSTVTVTSSNMTVLEDGKDSVVCKKVEVSSELTAASTKLVLLPTYSECTAKVAGVEAAATVVGGTCEDEIASFSEGPESAGEITELSGQLSIGPSGCTPLKFEDSTAKCSFEIPAQGPVRSAQIKPDGKEEWVAVTAELSNANITSGCAEKGIPVAFYITVNKVAHLVIEFLLLHLNFYNTMGAQINTLGFTAVSEPKEFTLKSPEHEWPIYVHQSMLTSGWTVTAGSSCYTRALYLPQFQCNMSIRSPASKPASGEFVVKGAFFRRGRLPLSLP